jgi:hypothetical protein
MVHSQNLKELIQKIENFLGDNFTGKKYDEEFNEYIYLDRSTGKYHVFPHAGGYLGKSGYEGRIFFDTLVSKLEEIDRENNCVNFYGAISKDDFVCNT